MPDVRSLQKDQLWSVDGLGFPPGYYFTTQSGGKTSQVHRKDYDGGRTSKELIVTDADTEDLTLTGKYRAAGHRAILIGLEAQLRRRVPVPATLKQLDVDADKTPIGVIDTKQGFLQSVMRPEHDQNSEEDGVFELVFTIV